MQSGKAVSAGISAAISEAHVHVSSGNLQDVPGGSA